MKKKWPRWVLYYKRWTTDEQRKVIFSDEAHFEAHGYKSVVVRWIREEPLQNEHIQQAPKHPPKKF